MSTHSTVFREHSCPGCVVRLKTIIQHDLTKRLTKCVQIINHEITISAIQVTSGSVDIFESNPNLLRTAYSEIASHIESISFESCNSDHSKAVNWWNQSKSEWIGDTFYLPLLMDELFEYIIRITNHIKSPHSVQISKERHEYEQNVAREYLYFKVLRRIMFAQVTIANDKPSRSESLIPDDAYIKSDYLNQLFSYLGTEHNAIWNSFSNTHMAKQWVLSVFRGKENAYKEVYVSSNKEITMHASSNNSNTDCNTIELNNTHNTNNAPLDTTNYSSVTHNSRIGLNPVFNTTESGFNSKISNLYIPTFQTQPQYNDNASECSGDTVMSNNVELISLLYNVIFNNNGNQHNNKN